MPRVRPWLGWTSSIKIWLLWLVAASVLPALIIIALLVHRATERERKIIADDTIETARALATAVDHEIDSAQAVLRALATSANLAAGNLAAFHAQASEVVSGKSGHNIVLSDAEGQQLVNTLRPFGAPLPRHGNPEQLRRIFETGKPSISDLYIGALAQRPLVGVEVPVLRDGKVIYDLSMGLFPERLGGILREQSAPSSWIISIFDRTGSIVARTHEAEGFVGQKGPPAVVRAIRGAAEGVVETETLDGVPALVAFSRSAVSGWAVAIGVPEAELTAGLWRDLWWIIAGVIVTLLASLAGVAAMGGHIAGTVGALKAAALALGKGEPLQPQTFDIGEAQQVADQMRDAARLLGQRAAERDALLATLEQRVATRTKELAESEARYRLLADNATDMIIHSGLDRVLHYVSPGSRTILGYAPEALIGRHPRPLVHPEDEPRVEAAIADLRDKAEQSTCTYRMKHKNGAYVWIEAAFHVLIDEPSQQRTSFVAVLRDITKRKEAEDRAERATLEAMAANRAKSEFLASMSHELRTPLNAIIGFAQLLLYATDERAIEKHREYAGYIFRGGNHLLELITDVLDLAKIESGRLRVSLERIEVESVLQELVATLSPMAREKEIALTLDPSDAQRLAIRADRARLLQVLMNLGSNAIKYNRPQGTVAIRAELVESDRLRIVVADTGMGIPAARQCELFQPFNRLGAEHSGIEGTGIGLSICRRLVELMDGSIGFASREGEGSRFWVEFPILTQPILIASVTRGSERLPSDQPAFTALYIEDNPSNIMLMSELVAELPNARLLTAPSGEIGVGLAIARRPDVVITDIHLPDISGFEVLKRLAAAPETARIPVIALSADAMPSDIARGRAAGFAAYITKPYSIAALLATIRGTALPASA